jgi:hypothetical protein
MHTVAETHDTLLRTLPRVDGLGLGTTDQVQVCALAGAEAPSKTSTASTAPAGSLPTASRKHAVRRADRPITHAKSLMADLCL